MSPTIYCKPPFKTPPRKSRFQPSTASTPCFCGDSGYSFTRFTLQYLAPEKARHPYAVASQDTASQDECQVMCLKNEKSRVATGLPREIHLKHVVHQNVHVAEANALSKTESPHPTQKRTKNAKAERIKKVSWSEASKRGKKLQP